MSQNTFRNKLKSGNKPKSGGGKSIFSWFEEKFDVTKILGEGVPVQLVPPVGFVALLALIYIWSNHRAENMVRKIEKAQQEVEDLRADVTTLEAEYMLSRMQSELAKKVAEQGIYELNQPPVKIEVE
ncbi:FtsL-like putative cell division protein [Algoriphagus sp. CAU 1675]|uniref:FtsL-like putative cell division protein n=1 Tax=Algoriphagus sp. CAU 1675 TaxID=3032597 RepID=UPI0023DBDD6B|nr:FtsL-like putative cell division protein [Algoriphagus sp. CAU 1675]MDF2156841.1 FtsL-like putative cell division protein [Algoriphagus sp. CAU 1675]